MLKHAFIITVHKEPDILKKVLKQAEDMGYTFDVGSECEFFLFHTDEDGLPTTTTHEKAGYFDVGPVDLGENARRDMVMNLEEMGFEIESSYHEKAAAQHEIDFRYDNALKAADNIMTFKLTVKSIARRHGLHATFMPKPKNGVNGSGMHLHLSLSRDGVNLFDDQAGEYGLSKEAYYFIAGIMAHMKGITLIANPIVNSYKRLIPGYEAPVYIGWSGGRRTPLIRIPASRGQKARVELRSPDPVANPYLLLAACLAAGLEGIRNQMKVPEEMGREEEKKEMECIPGNLQEAIAEFEKDTFLQDVLGEHVSSKYVKHKKAEWNSYHSQVTEWEMDEYLYRL